MAQDCIFCKIASGEQPAAEVLRTDKVVSFLDINPVNPGHCLVIPTRHAENLMDLQEEELHACISAAQKVGEAVMAVTDSPGLNLLQNNHRCAGQVVSHAHFHVIPRDPGDGFSFGWRQQTYPEGEMDALQRDIQDALEE